MEITLRPIERADVPALARLYAASEAVDVTGEHYNEADLEEELDNPDLELGKDVMGAFAGDDLVGYWSVMLRKSADDPKVVASGMTRPDHRGQGIGETLVVGMLARARELRQEVGGPLRVLCSGVDTNTEQADLLQRAGFAADRWSFTMRVELGDVPEAPPMPPGYAVRTYRPADEEPWRAAHNLAFRDHPNFAVWQPSEWRQWVTGSRAFRPELSYLVTVADEPETIAAYVQTNEYDAFTEVTGRREAYVGKVGTLPEHRGKGLASTLLRYCLRAYQEAGYDEASLDVDSLNPTGALGIYERAGFATERVFVTYAMTLT